MTRPLRPVLAKALLAALVLAAVWAFWYRPWLSGTQRSCLEVESSYNTVLEYYSKIPASGLAGVSLQKKLDKANADVREVAVASLRRDIPSPDLRAALEALADGQEGAATTVAQACLVAGQEVDYLRLPAEG